MGVRIVARRLLGGASSPFRSRQRAAVLACGVTGALVAGGIAWAAIPDPGTGVIHGCYNKTTGALRVIDPSLGQTCASTEASLKWNERGVNFRGTWNSTIAYAVNDAVVLNGSSYIAKLANTNSAPPNANWRLLAQKGATGATGPAGPKGAQGPQGPSAGFTSATDSVALANGTGNTTVVSLTLPAGSYIVQAKLVPYIGSGVDSMHCDLVSTDGFTVLDQNYATLNAVTDSFGSTFADTTIGLLAPLTTSGGTISVGCEDNQSNVMTVFRNRLSAVQLGSVSSAASQAAKRASSHRSTNPSL